MRNRQQVDTIKMEQVPPLFLYLLK